MKIGYMKDEEEAVSENPKWRGFDLFCLLGLGIQTNPLKCDHKTSHWFWSMYQFGKTQSTERRDLKQVSF